MDSEHTTEYLTTKSIQMEDAFARQVDRIFYLRSYNRPWYEALKALRSALYGLEDDEFYDGIPPQVRAEMKEMDEKEQALVRERFKRLGWNRVKSFARPTPLGPRYRPTPEQLEAMYEIVMRMAKRAQIVWKHRKQSRLGPRIGASGADDGV